ncbi:TraB/GumN family protein [Sphingosinicella terrae]|uniref:TraB/GumN family protein n=1 Tax=Sphingosinicella terrae TaxID=2172047 RepID=UPI0013B3B784|nr:TraB/GumN family protein [Sphingosinicella terrae]
MRLKKRIGTWLAAPAALAFLLCAPAAATPAEAPAPSPAIWLLADEDTRIYLFGTVHVLPPDLVWRSEALNRVVEDADELVMEIGEEPDPDDAANLFGPMMMDKSVSILGRVSPDHREGLREMIEASGIPIEVYDHMHSWGASFLLVGAAFRQAYADPDAPEMPLTGVEDSLRADFERNQRPISGVESVEAQLDFFRTMPLGAQREFLESMVEAHHDGDAVFDPEEAGWVRGDVDSVGAEMEALPPALFDRLITRRNAAWTNWLIDRLRRPGTVLFAVGAGHLAGRDSVQSMLAARGLTARRLP